jgi:hypothetical protein
MLAALAVASAVGGYAGFGSTGLAAGALVSLCTYIALGMVSVKPSAADIAASRSVPLFVLHKLSVLGGLVVRRGPAQWQRTARD